MWNHTPTFLLLLLLHLLLLQQLSSNGNCK